VLWGTDNLKNEGQPIAQALALLGAEPRTDALGRIVGARLLPLATLGRPRIDVIMTLSGLFRDPLPRADVITMGHILHDWDLQKKKALVKKAYDALPTGGSFVVFEAMIDDDRSKNAFGLLMSLNMLIETPGGFDYTAADCVAWMKEAGFKETRVQHLVGPDTMVVGIK